MDKWTKAAAAVYAETQAALQTVYDALNQGSKLTFRDLKAGIAAGKVIMVDETTGKEIVLEGEFTERQQAILLCGGLLNYTKENS